MIILKLTTRMQYDKILHEFIKMAGKPPGYFERCEEDYMSNQMLQTDADRKVRVQDMTANPAPLGLLGFGMTTVLLNLHNAGLLGQSSMILAMGIFYGGLAQVIAEIMEWKKKNTFGATAFTSFGFFWLSLVAIWVMPVLGWTEAPGNIDMAAYLFMWCLFTAVMFVGTLKINRPLQIVFGLLALLFFLLALGDLTEITAIKLLAGYEGTLCGISAIYAGLSQVIKELYIKKEVI